MTNPDKPQIDHHEDRASQYRSLLTLVFVAAFVALSVWLVTAFRAHNRTIECLEAGHHDCIPLDTTARGE